MAFLMLILSVLFAAVDQLLKMFVVRDIKPLGSKTLIPGLLSLDYTENTGAAFSMMEGGRWIFVAVTLVVCAAIVFAMFRYRGQSFFFRAASALIVGGGIGNVIDRVQQAHVVDYIHVSFFPAIFNFADCCVVIGVIFFVIHILFFTEKSDVEKVLRTK